MKVLIVGSEEEICDDIVETYSQGDNEIFVINKGKNDFNINSKSYSLNINNSRVEQVLRGKDKYTLIFPNEALTEVNCGNTPVAENIFDKALSIGEEIMGSKEIGVYKVSQDEAYLRLVSVSGSLNRQDIKNSYRVDENIEIGQVIQHREVYFNKAFNEKLPSMMCPIIYDDKVVAIIAYFKALNEVSPYYRKLFKLVGSMVTSTMVQVYKYEGVNILKNYVEGTRILYEEYFKEFIKQKKKYKDENHIEYTVLKLRSDFKDPKEIYEIIKGSIRAVDQLGLNIKKELFLTLTNTCEAEASFVIERLKEMKILAEIICEDSLI